MPTVWRFLSWWLYAIWSKIVCFLNCLLVSDEIYPRLSQTSSVECLCVFVCVSECLLDKDNVTVTLLWSSLDGSRLALFSLHEDQPIVYVYSPIIYVLIINLTNVIMCYVEITFNHNFISLKKDLSHYYYFIILIIFFFNCSINFCCCKMSD